MAFVIGSTSLNTWLNKPISWSPRTNTCVPKCVVLCARAVTLNNHDSSDQRAVIALDVGTSSIKSALYFIDSDADQKAVPKLGQVFRRPHQTTVGEPGVLTQKPDDWYDGAILAMRDVVRHQQSSTKIVAISVTGQMQDLIAVGNDRPALLKSDAILYTDTRAVKQAQDLSSKLSTPVLASSLLAKLKLIPFPSLENGEMSYKLLFGAADYMTFIFTDGASGACTDATTVSTTGLSVGPEHRKYDINTLRRAGLEAFVPHFPQILERTGRVGSLSEKVARDIGAEDLTGIDVVHAGGDAFSATAGVNCAALGSGSYLYAGTTGWIAGTVTVEESRSASVRGSLFHLGHAVSRNVILAASVASVGSALEYVGREILGCSVQELTELAAQSVIGSHGVVMCTYLNGRRCPRPVDQTKGMLFGMQMSTRRCDIARAAVEGVVFSLAEAYKEMPAGTTQGTVRVVGGVSRCGIMLEGISALIGTVEVRAGNDMEAGLLGAGAGAEGCDERGTAATASGRLIDVDDKSRREWDEAMRRWQQVVASSEPLWG